MTSPLRKSHQTTAPSAAPTQANSRPPQPAADRPILARARLLGLLQAAGRTAAASLILGCCAEFFDSPRIIAAEPAKVTRLTNQQWRPARTTGKRVDPAVRPSSHNASSGPALGIAEIDSAPSVLKPTSGQMPTTGPALVAPQSNSASAPQLLSGHSDYVQPVHQLTPVENAGVKALPGTSVMSTRERTGARTARLQATAPLGSSADTNQANPLENGAAPETPSPGNPFSNPGDNSATPPAINNPLATEPEPSPMPPAELPDPQRSTLPGDRALDSASPAPLGSGAAAPSKSSGQTQEDCKNKQEAAEKDFLDITLGTRILDLSPTSKGEIPYECAIESGSIYHGDRSWGCITYTWKASALCHKPLYFEQVQAERYGHSWGPVLDPVLQSAHFFGTIPLLPYHMGVDPICECQYALGYYRPGNCAPYMIEPFPLSLRGAATQGIFTAGAIYAVP
ncbi:MAG: hypothetical protein SFX18_11710 [Pirellulales bacterium]|nr:hypothetical protein [Pirellulales bacterium]